MIIFAPLLFVFGLSAAVQRMQPATARLVFLAFAAVMGLSLSSIFLVFTAPEHRPDVLHHGGFVRRAEPVGLHDQAQSDRHGLVPVHGPDRLIIAMVVNIFLQSPAMQFAISAIGVLIFAGLTAYDTQRLKNTYDFVAGNQVAAGRASIIGALQLYLDFINLFMFLLQFMGNRN